jgi:hypothetical protein
LACLVKLSKGMKVNFELSIRWKVIFGCLQVGHVYDYMSLIEYCNILKYRTTIPLFFINEVCPIYHKACLDRFEERAVYC